jgi:membrane-bound lytic murein transglycosylase B
MQQAIIADTDFSAWVAGFRRVAMRRGISAATFDQAFDGVAYDPDVVAKDQNQSEQERSIWAYLDSAVSAQRVTDGLAALARHACDFDMIQSRYGVDKETLSAIWGMESAYGMRRGDVATIQALATLAFDGRRRVLFERQLIAALQIVQFGEIRPRDMVGSWAGAMGHTQFMPTSFLVHAVDGDGDGKRDIWSDSPIDALASTASYLARAGWRHGQRPAIEVRLPDGFDYGLTSKVITKLTAIWATLGVRAMDNATLPDCKNASVILPAGARGVALLTLDNFHAIWRYNRSDAYVIAVGHLADRLRGAGPFVADWPRDQPPLGRADMRELQQHLTAAGFDTQGADGLSGPNTQAAIRACQRANGLTADGYGSCDLLLRLR